MTFDEWVESERKRLEEFKAYWMTNHSAAPEHFPLEMNEGDWDEQFHFFGSSE